MAKETEKWEGEVGALQAELKKAEAIHIVKYAELQHTLTREREQMQEQLSSTQVWNVHNCRLHNRPASPSWWLDLWSSLERY